MQNQYETMVKAALNDTRESFVARDPDRPVEPWLVMLYHPSGVIPPEHDITNDKGGITSYAHGDCPCNALGPIPDTIEDWAAED